MSTTAQEGNDKAHEGAVDVTAGSVPDEVEGVCRTDGTLRRRVGNEKVQQTQVTTTLVGDCVNNICISNKPIHYREGMALEPSPVQGDISVVAAGTCGLSTDNMGLQVEVDDGELVDTAQQEHDRLEHELFHETTSDEEESDFPFVHWQDTYWQELGASVIRWAWQRDTIALTVALVTGNNTAFGRGLLAETDVWCGWVGSNMDRAPSREGHVRLMELNPRVMAQADKGERQQMDIWERAVELEVNAVLLPDDGLVDPTTASPKTSLIRSTALAREAWQQQQLVWTHGQGQAGLKKTVVGGVSLVADDSIAKIQGLRFEDSRGWGRFVGRVLIGSDAKRILLITVYFPTDSTGEGSAWQTQLRGMQSIDFEHKKSDPWMQAVYDLERQVSEFMMASKSQEVKDGTSLIIMGDFNARIEHCDKDLPFSTRCTDALQQMMHMHAGCERGHAASAPWGVATDLHAV